MAEIQRFNLRLTMKTQFDIHKTIERGTILDELELERASIARRKLGVLAKEDPKFLAEWKKLGELIRAYETENWGSNSRITDKRIEESDLAESIAENERVFIQRRKDLIKSKMKKVGLNQQQLGSILGHRSKTYMSELMSGICPFSLKDLIIINRLMKIDLTDLIPTFLPHMDRVNICANIAKLENPNLKLSQDDFTLVAG